MHFHSGLHTCPKGEHTLWTIIVEDLRLPLWFEMVLLFSIVREPKPFAYKSAIRLLIIHLKVNELTIRDLEKQFLFGFLKLRRPELDVNLDNLMCCLLHVLHVCLHELE
jgi:hypothetical protein